MTPAIRAVMNVILDAPADDPAYGLRICETTGYGTGSVYPALNKLMKAGWITDRWEDMGDDRPRRRFYFPAYTPEWYRERLDWN